VLCCTNSDYARSEYCRIEAVQVLDVPGKENRDVLDIRMPDEANPVSEALSQRGIDSVVAAAETLQETWEKCCRFLGFAPSALPRRETNGTVTSFEVMGRPFEMAIDPGWNVRRIDHTDGRTDTTVASFVRQIGGVRIEGVLIVGVWAISVSRAGAISVPREAGTNDRAMFEAIIDAIREWNRYGGKVFYPRGVHVVHVPGLCGADGKPVAHPAFTYLDPGWNDYDRAIRVPLAQCTWHRQYPIRVALPGAPSALEFVFGFDVKGVASDDFATFCRHAYLMDDLVRSLRFEQT